jgi:hypothetical protein
MANDHYIGLIWLTAVSCGDDLGQLAIQTNLRLHLELMKYQALSYKAMNRMNIMRTMND